MDNTDIYKIIGKTFSGEANADEILELNKWLEKDEQNLQEYTRLKEIWKNTKINDQYSNKERVFQNFLRKKEFFNEHHAKEKERSNHKDKNDPKSHRWIRYVAAAIAVILLGTTYLSLLPQKPAPDTNKKQCLTIKENPKGQKSKIVLSDGTIVWLNSDSKISYSPGFSDTLRSVTLTGEAYFQVAKDHKRPFVVTAGTMSTTALGTEFNVSYYPEDKFPTVYLAEGKVKVEEKEQQNIVEYLEPGWGLGPIGSERKIQRFNDDSDKWISWREGILQFQKADLKTVIKKCERWYNVEIEVKGTIPNNWNFTGKFKNEYLDNILTSMNYGKDLRYKIEDEHITLTFK